MRIAINALTVREGGGLVALEKLLNQFIRLKPEYEYYVIASQALPQLSFMEHEAVHRCNHADVSAVHFEETMEPCYG